MNIDEAKRAAAAKDGVIAAASAWEIAEDAGIVFTVLPSAVALRDILTRSDGLISAGNERLIVADCGTFELADKEQCRALLETACLAMLDCTISGTGAQAQVKDVVVLRVAPSTTTAVVSRRSPALRGRAIMSGRSETAAK